MTCRCTCGGCDCPQIKVTMLPSVAVAGAVPAGNAIDWGYGAANAANPLVVTIRFDTTGCAPPPCPPLLDMGTCR